VVKFDEVRASLPAETEPVVQSERLARELANVPVEQREKVVKAAEKSGKVTAKTVREAAKQTEKTVADDIGPGAGRDGAQVLGSKKRNQRSIIELACGQAQLPDDELR